MRRLGENWVLVRFEVSGEQVLVAGKVGRSLEFRIILRAVRLVVVIDAYRLRCFVLVVQGLQVLHLLGAAPVDSAGVLGGFLSRGAVQGVHTFLGGLEHAAHRGTEKVFL